MSVARATAGMLAPACASMGKPASKSATPAVTIATVNGVPVDGSAVGAAAGETPVGEGPVVGAHVKDNLSEVTALELFRRGLQYATGQGVAMDFIAAHKFFNLAALKGFEAAKERRRELATVMSREEIAKAQRAAREWLEFAH
jgi:hypothetical protein